MGKAGSMCQRGVYNPIDLLYELTALWCVIIRPWFGFKLNTIVVNIHTVNVQLKL